MTFTGSCSKRVSGSKNNNNLACHCQHLTGDADRDIRSLGDKQFVRKKKKVTYKYSDQGQPLPLCFWYYFIFALFVFTIPPQNK